jgi:WD40 repeat protein/uncharacterized caspase-like protein
MESIYAYQRATRMKNLLKMFLVMWLVLSAQAQVNAQQPELVVQTGHIGAVLSVAFSPDGMVLASGGDDHSIKLWEVETGRKLRTLTGHPGSVSSVAFSPDGKVLASGGSKTIKLWEVATGRELRTLTGHLSRVSSVAFSPDGKVLASGGNGPLLSNGRGSPIRLWEVETGRELRSFKGHLEISFTPPGYSGPQTFETLSYYVTSIAFSPDGKVLASGSHGKTIKLWEVATGRELRTLVGHLSGVSSVAFSPDGKVLASGGRNLLRSKDRDDQIRLWEVKTGRELRSLTGHSDGVLSVAFSPDGKILASGGADGTVNLWEVATGQVLRSVRVHSSAVTSVTYSPNGRVVVSGGLDANIKRLEVATGQVRRISRSDYKVAASVTFSLDGKVVASGSYDNTVMLWEAARGGELRILTGHSDGVLSVAFSPDGKVLASGSDDRTVKLWEVATGRELRSLSGHSAKISSIVFSPDGKVVASGSDDKTIKLWEVATGRELHALTGHLNKVSSVIFSPDGKMLASGSRDGSIKLWEAETGRNLRTLTGHIKYAPDILLWLSRIDDQYPMIMRLMRPVTSVAFSPDGKVLASGHIADKTIKLWEVATGRELRTLTGHLSGVSSVAFSPDGKVLASGRGNLQWIKGNGDTIEGWEFPTGRDDVIKLREVETGRELPSLKGHSGRIIALTFIAEGKVVASGSSDNSIRLWDATTGRSLASLVALNRGDWLVVAPDGRFDTTNLDEIDEIRMLHWTIPDDPLRTLPPEIFMRDYYEPRLLERLLSGEQLPSIPDLSTRNRVRPQVRIADVKLQTNAPDTVDDIVTVIVEVTKATGTLIREGKQVTLESGAHNLRLFRDGQLVGYAPEKDGPIKLESGKATITFKDIKLPRRADLKQVEFSAYAYNTDRVKSNTDRGMLTLLKPLPTVKGRAYVITVGINAYENPALDLRFAANDAQRLHSVLTEKLEKLKTSGEYEEIVPITLLSDYELKDGHRTITAQQATKSNVKLVLDLLAGKQFDPAQLASIPNADKLRQARPEDLVIISFASHGYADNSGRFYFVTYDTGTGTKPEVTPELLVKSISSDELSLWLRDVDAGEMVMIVDACQSAAAVEGEGFKPGPMGSRGLGQLAYDKGMRILAATQADNVALENKLIRQGLLTYALVHDGIEMGRADFKPEDKMITLGEWLAYAVERVPQLFDEVKRGQVRGTGQDAGAATKIVLLPQAGGESNQAGPVRLLIQGKTVSGAGKLTLAEEQIQRPALFDFSRKKRDVLLMQK